ncbi:MAG TPA: hypothetical protein VKQ32_19830 [Polyangia bacterium]|nr:hypothetical protein [Polyangia bacterium]
MSRRVKSGSLLLLTIGVAGAALLAAGCGGSVKSDDAGMCAALLCGQVEVARPVAAGSCTFVTGCPPDAHVTGMSVFVGGQLVPMDPTLIEGWNFTDTSMSAFVLYGQACADALTDAGTGGVTNVWQCELALGPWRRRCTGS